MSERLFDFFDAVLQRYFGTGVGSYPRIGQHDIDTLLCDDTHRRLMRGRAAAVDWGAGEVHDTVVITCERLLVTHHGLVYIAELGTPARPLYYLATPPLLFGSIVDRVGATSLQPGSAAAVDCRFGHDLLFPWPLDAALRRTLDDAAVFRLEAAATH